MDFEESFGEIDGVRKVKICEAGNLKRLVQIHGSIKDDQWEALLFNSISLAIDGIEISFMCSSRDLI